MASQEFKEAITLRFKELYDLLIRRGLARNNTELGNLMDVSSGAVAKMLIGERIITLEQTAKLSERTGINAHKLLTGEGPVFVEITEKEDAIAKLSRMMNDGTIPPKDGESIIETILELRRDNTSQKDEIVELNQKLLKLMQRIRQG
jgi:hypothetical protein